MGVTKMELQEMLGNDVALGEIFNFTDGQDCVIFKADDFDNAKSDEVVYIPDIDLNEIRIASSVSYRDEIGYILANCYTKRDFLAECKANEKMARDLFDEVDWQHPNIQDLLDGYTEDEALFNERYGCSLNDFN